MTNSADIEIQPINFPVDCDAEQSLLSAILLDPDRLPTLGLKTSDFFDGWNRDIFKAMLSLHKAGLPLTGVRIRQELLSLPGSKKDGCVGAGYLADLLNDPYTLEYLDDDASIIREKARKREFLMRVPDLLKRSQNGTRTDALGEQWTAAIALLKEDKPEAVAELFTSVGELLDTPDKPIPWAVHEVLPQGALTIIAAEPGAGKSTMLRDLAVCVAQGRPFQGREVKQGPVLLFSLEESKPMVVKHLRQMDVQRDDPIHIRFEPLDDAVSQVRAAVERIKPAMVIIDPLPKFVAIDDLNSYGQVSPAMDALVQLAHEGEGTNIVVVTHTNKAGEDTRPGGSIAFAASADVILHVGVEGADRRRVLSGVKNRFDERYLLEPTVIGLDYETGHTTTEGSRDEAIYAEVSSNILAWLAAHDGPQKQKDLLKAMGGKSAISHRALTRLADVGKVEIDKNKKPFVCSIPATVPTVPDSSRDLGTMKNQLPLPQFPGSPPVGGQEPGSKAGIDTITEGKPSHSSQEREPREGLYSHG